jgi:DNA-directed RNA polymerase subunit F
MAEEEERYATIAEVKNLLEQDEKDGSTTYEKRLALEHAKQFTTLTNTKCKQLVNQLIKMERVSEFLAYKIVELLPQYPDEVRPIFAKERFTLEEAEIKQIIEIVKKFK